MKLLVIGGMHGNETLGLEVVKLFQDNPVNQVDTLLANEQAIKANCRFVGRDLNRSFPGDSKSSEYEPRRAAQILKRSKKYDIVLDFHNTYCPDNDCGFVGGTASNMLTDVAWALGLDKVIVADYDCINKAATNCLSVEVSLDSPLNDAKIWYERIVMLSRLDSFTTKSNVQKYCFAYRMTVEDKERLQLDGQNLEAFQPLTRELAGAMGVASPAYPIFVGDKFTPYNYGGLLNKL
ncbi:hypothetical protein EON76_02795 [bacterium]|nr:MAG: hypothetical protein EON76_02795 [bacterium]